MSLQDELRDWAEKVVGLYNKAVVTDKDTAYDFYTQSNLMEIADRPEILILGINPGSGGIGEHKEKARDVFLKGNDDFHNHTQWRFWKGLISIFHEGGIEDLLANDRKYVVSNVYYIATEKAGEIPSSIMRNEKLLCLTKELIGILHPKRVLCLGSFATLMKGEEKTAALIDGVLNFGHIEDIPVFGIHHTSGHPYSSEEKLLVGKALGFAFENPACLDKEIFSERFSAEITAYKKRGEARRMVEAAFKEKNNQLKWFEDKGIRWYWLVDNYVRVRIADTSYVNIRISNVEDFPAEKWNLLSKH